VPCSIIILTYLVSDHRIRQYGPSPVYSIEIPLFHPNDSINNSVSSTADCIPAILESNYECSPNVRDRWTDYDLLQVHEGVQYSEPLTILDNWFPIGDSAVQDDNPQEYIDPSVLTRSEHEPLNYYPSGISQSVSEASAQSQFLLNPIPPDIQHIPSTTYTAALDYEQESGSRKSQRLSYPAPLQSSPSQPASPASSGQASSDAPEGKMEIASARTKYVCPSCRESFTTGLRYRRHFGVLGCQTSSFCHDCGKKFTKEKDLQRHRGHTNAAPSCPKLKAIDPRVKPFACTCNLKAYKRKDSLLRHLRNLRGHAGDDLQQHRCKACDRAFCSCS
jgi:hypothetical protein